MKLSFLYFPLNHVKCRIAKVIASKLPQFNIQDQNKECPVSCCLKIELEIYSKLHVAVEPMLVSACIKHTQTSKYWSEGMVNSSTALAKQGSRTKLTNQLSSPSTFAMAELISSHIVLLN